MEGNVEKNNIYLENLRIFCDAEQGKASAPADPDTRETGSTVASSLVKVNKQ
jgi:hypothetical protein